MLKGSSADDISFLRGKIMKSTVVGVAEMRQRVVVVGSAFDREGVAKLVEGVRLGGETRL